MKCKNCNILLVLLILVTTHIPCYGQWAITYGESNHDSAYSIQLTIPDGGYVVAGENGINFWVLKLEPDGTVEWEKIYGGFTEDNANSIKQTSDGGYIVAGWTGSFSVNPIDAWVLKLNPNGSVAWQKIYDGGLDEQINDIQQTLPDGGYILAGSAECGLGQGDLWVLKLDSDGLIAWQNCYGGTGSEVAYAIQQTADGGFIVVGRMFISFDTWDDVWILKLNADGSVAWEKAYGGSADDHGYSVEQTPEGDYVVAGSTRSYGAGGTDAWVLKLDSVGEVIWQKTYGGSNGDRASSVQQAPDGGYILAGLTSSFGAGGHDFWMMKLHSDGTIEWEHTYGGIHHDRAYSVSETADGSYVIAGETLSFGAGIEEDFLVLKLDENGEVSDCDIIGTSTAVVTTTTAIAKTNNSTMEESSATASDTNISSQDTSAQESVICYFTSTIEVDIDIKPGSCPNELELKVKKEDVIQITILGAEDFDVTNINPDTIQLSRKGFQDGFTPISWKDKDVATPFDGELCECHKLKGDGYADLCLKFDASEIVSALGAANEGDVLELTITGELFDGTLIGGADCMVVVKG